VTGWLLYTNIFSELRRPKPAPKVLAFIAAHPLDHLYVCVVTFAENRFGIELVADASRRAELNDRLAHKVRPMFEERVLPMRADLLAARFDHRSDGALPRADHPVPRYERIRARPRAGRRSVAVRFCT
jgi:predicted nucleic acid-binding protein